MEFDFTAALFALSRALDRVEHDLLGVTTNHGKRVAALAVAMGERYGLCAADKLELAACATLHDCALAEYVQEEYGGTFLESLPKAVAALPGNLGPHCTLGEANVKKLPLSPKTAGAVLYHHENANGTGPFGKVSAEIPLYARLIQIADMVDARYNLSAYDAAKAAAVEGYLDAQNGTLFAPGEVAALRGVLAGGEMQNLRPENLDAYLRQLLPPWQRACSPAELIAFSTIFATLVDYKSHFTSTHSVGIAQKAKKMGEFYGVDEMFAAKLYFAGALHDIGKLTVDRDILEKPAGLTGLEYRHIQTHAYATYQLLSPIQGMEEITRWAAHHHEKLDGSGYPFGLKAEQLSHWERLMACLDIYQALTEDRPYKAGMTHAQAIAILQHMAALGKLDGGIVADIDTVYAPAQPE
ncbi:MAG: HD domain-containing protein [Gemmiger sp.]|nr:HD domain-containing protein [Gemmiger sp.]